MSCSRHRYERDSAARRRGPISLLEIIEPLERVEAVAPDESIVDTSHAEWGTSGLLQCTCMLASSYLAASRGSPHALFGLQGKYQASCRIGRVGSIEHARSMRTGMPSLHERRWGLQARGVSSYYCSVRTNPQ
jgi:hypothetical protein